jgi:DNA-binding CsgD family transcriptional regulator
VTDDAPTAMQYGVGPIGARIVEVAADRGYEFLGGLDVDPANIGEDLGVVAGTEPLGVEVTDDADAIARRGPDGVFHATGSSLAAVRPQLAGALAAGADGYLLKNAEPEQLCQAIRQVAAGQGALSPEVTERVMKAAASQDQPATVTLSPREQEVLAEVARGATTAEIATTLVISENTVKTHVRRILKKLEASNRTEAVAQAAALGLLSQS